MNDQQIQSLLEHTRFAKLPDAEKLGYLADYSRRNSPEAAMLLLQGYLFQQAKQA